MTKSAEMMFFLDSANIKDARACEKWGWVKGVTTNPSILAKNKRSVEETLDELQKIFDGPVFYQLTGKTKKKHGQRSKICLWNLEETIGP